LDLRHAIAARRLAEHLGGRKDHRTLSRLDANESVLAIGGCRPVEQVDEFGISRSPSLGPSSAVFKMPCQSKTWTVLLLSVAHGHVEESQREAFPGSAAPYCKGATP
jgi:hypothetical protein